MKRGLPTGVQRKHSRRCPAHPSQQGAAARCRSVEDGCGYQVQAGSRHARQTATFATLAEATAWKRDVDEMRAQGATVRPEGRIRVAGAAEAFLAAVRDGRAVSRSGTPYRLTTIAGYERDLRAHVIPTLGDRWLSQVTRGDVLEMTSKLQRAGYSPSTVRNVVMPLRALFTYAIDHEWVSSNPTRGVSMPGLSRSRRLDSRDADEVRALIAAQALHDRPLWATAFYTGLRCGELMALRWDDVDIEAGTVTVRASWDRKAHVLNAPKSEAGFRDVDLPRVLVPFLTAHRERAIGGLVFARGTLDGRCQPGREAEPFTDTAIGVRAGHACKAAGLRPITLHVARHSFATMMLNGGVPMPVVSVLLGHSTIAVTVDIYGHMSDRTRREAADVLDRLAGDVGDQT